MNRLLTASLLASLLIGLSAKARTAEAGPELKPDSEPVTVTKEDGYRGIWYMNQPTKDEYRYKYSGGFATYPQQHAPIAIYASEADKTFFCYGGTIPGKQRLLHMVSWYDHNRKLLARPTRLLDKETEDAHDNPTLLIDLRGHLWIFSNAHGTSRPAFIHRSRKPYDIEEFDRVLTTNFSYGQPWLLADGRFFLLHTRYENGRSLFQMRSDDGFHWSAPERIIRILGGDYQITWAGKDKVGTAFDYHPLKLGVNARTNLYYMETSDAGLTWRTAAGEELKPPLTDAKNAALVHDYQAEGLLVYMKDIQFDGSGRPVLLFLTAKGFEPGPENGPRIWQTARWDGAEWVFRGVTESDHNYDHGSFYIESDGTWRLIAPTDPGPQPFATGGEVVMWTSRDQGATWGRVKSLTPESQLNHTYVRRPLHARPDFYALWADGNPLEPSESRLYFTDQQGGNVWRMPENMGGREAPAEKAW